MPDNVNESASESPSATPETTEAAGSSCCTRGSCCKPHTSAIIAVIALILAGYAAYASSSGQDDSAVYARLDTLDSKVTALSGQITTLNEAVESNRENLIQTKLKKALQNIQDISNLAGEGTKAAIAEVENMLKTLTSISQQLATPAPTESTPAASIEPASEAVAEPAPESEAAPETTAPAEITPPESSQPKSEAAAQQPDTSAADRNATDKTAVTPDVAPAQAADATVATPAETPAATTAPPADIAPAAEPSAPQAF